jgi:hypothetical protein
MLSSIRPFSLKVRLRCTYGVLGLKRLYSIVFCLDRLASYLDHYHSRYSSHATTLSFQVSSRSPRPHKPLQQSKLQIGRCWNVQPNGISLNSPGHTRLSGYCASSEVDTKFTEVDHEVPTCSRKEVRLGISSLLHGECKTKRKNIQQAGFPDGHPL